MRVDPRFLQTPNAVAKAGPSTHTFATHFDQCVFERPVSTLWKVRRAPEDFLHFSAPQRVLLRFVVRGNLLDGLANTRFTPKSLLSHTPVPSCFPRCHPLSPPRTPHVTPPTPVGPGTPPAAPKQVSHRRFRLWSAPNPASAPWCSPLLVAPPQYTLNPRSAVGRDPRRPPMPGFPARQLRVLSASAPRAFRISTASIPHAPNKPAKALAKARSRHHNVQSFHLLPDSKV
ncbi:hypothetical protein PGT21_033449 [Puccinia graminis f. sp. tritici]|uniref:Uncharacterized protein n=1 Tax=Puccinia graminis f. sp. tritici TaxID=56615 RepID=A0A5B0LSD5_PUCGR|nr:hypothetical protein PGT21_033449 [Puccinia graminis f. sp. tritici]